MCSFPWFPALSVVFKKVCRRKYSGTLAQIRGVMSVIAGDQIFGTTGEGNFKKWFVVRVWQRTGKRGGCHDPAAVFNIIQKGGNLVLFESESGTTQYVMIFGQDAGIET
jgi:hypothetical protein